MTVCIMPCICNQATLLIEPDIGNRFFIERPASRIAHEREHQEVNGQTKSFFHGRNVNWF